MNKPTICFGTWIIFVCFALCMCPIQAFSDLAYVVNMDGNSISILDIDKGNRIIKTISKDICGPTAIAITPNKKYAYVTNAGNNTVAVVMLENENQVIRSITRDINSPYGIAITPNGKYAYVTSLGNDSVVVIDIENDHKVIQRISGDIVRPYGIALTPNGKYAYVANLGSNSITVINTENGNQIEKRITQGINNPYTVAIDPQGRYAYVVNGGSQTIAVIDIERDHRVVQVIEQGMSTPYAISITPNGKYVLVGNYCGGLTVIDRMDYHKIIRSIDKHMNRPYAINITSNGKYAYIANLGNNSITIIDIEEDFNVASTLNLGFNCPYGIAFLNTAAPSSILSHLNPLTPSACNKNVQCCFLHDEHSLFDESASLIDYLTAFPNEDYELCFAKETGYFCLDKVNDPIKNALRQGEIWEEHVHKQVKKHALPGTTVLDVGAHIGTETIIMAQCVGSLGKVYTFEPQKKNFRELWANCLVNKVDDRVVLHRMAIGSTHKQVEIGRIVTSSDGEVDEGGIGIWGGGDVTEMRSIDSFNFDNVSLVKIDVEGCENDVLDGMVETIKKNQPVIIIEICGGWIWDTAPPDIKSRILFTQEKLSDLGYEIHHLKAWDYIAFPKSKIRNHTNALS